MANGLKDTAIGGISFSAPTIQGGVINGGFTFDLPMATIQSMMNQATTTFNANATANRGFFSNVQAKAQSGLTAAGAMQERQSTRAISSIQGMHGATTDLQRYVIKKTTGSSCFITTAVCEHFGLPDDCPELEALREFRDTFMDTEEYRPFIEEYYKIAPKIVEAIKTSDNRDAELSYLLTFYIFPCAETLIQHDIDTRQKIAVFEHYRAMVKYLRGKYRVE